VHKETVEAVPGAKQGYDDIDVEVFGMQGVPPEALKEHGITVADGNS